MIEFRIARREALPAYLQIVEQTRQSLEHGRLAVGDQLPTAREVVSTTGINPNTVLKAYRELERQGLVEGRVGTGTFVTADLARLQSDLTSPLAADLRGWLDEAVAAGMGRHEVVALVNTMMDEREKGMVR
ncbi:MAG: GntR family transcriptional regulator [Nakamurella sp.]